KLRVPHARNVRQVGERWPGLVCIYSPGVGWGRRFHPGGPTMNDRQESTIPEAESAGTLSRRRVIGGGGIAVAGGAALAAGGSAVLPGAAGAYAGGVGVGPSGTMVVEFRGRVS